MNYLGKTIKTSVVQQKNDQVFWGQEIWIPVHAPLVSSRLVMSVFDYDAVDSNDIVGSMCFELHEILRRANESNEFPWMWKDIYGAAPGVTGEHTDLMNTIPEYASHWRGRILMQVVCEMTENPQMKLMNVSEDVIEQAKEKFINYKYEIKAEVSQGVSLPGGDFKVKIKVGEFEIKTGSPKKNKNGF